VGLFGRDGLPVQQCGPSALGKSGKDRIDHGRASLDVHCRLSGKDLGKASVAGKKLFIKRKIPSGRKTFVTIRHADMNIITVLKDIGFHAVEGLVCQLGIGACLFIEGRYE
jgi:hypothetical protein